MLYIRSRRLTCKVSSMPSRGTPNSRAAFELIHGIKQYLSIQVVLLLLLPPPPPFRLAHISFYKDMSVDTFKGLHAHAEPKLCMSTKTHTHYLLYSQRNHNVADVFRRVTVRR